LQIEPPIIILITFLIKKIITNLKNEKHFMIFSLILFLILISVFIYVLIQNIDNFSFTRKIYKSKLENNEKFLSRILVN
jgi:competence protein ComGC